MMPTLAQGETKSSSAPSGPWTLEEELALMGELQGEALALVETLKSQVFAPTPQEGQLLAQVEECLSQGRFTEVNALVETLIGEGGRRRPRRDLLEELSLLAMRLLRLGLFQALPGVLGEVRCGREFFLELRGQPGLLGEMLLAALEIAPQESFSHTLFNLQSNLAQWRQTPTLSGSRLDPWALEACSTIYHLTSHWRALLESLEEPLRAAVCALLRGRLERCEDVLALPAVWSFEGYLNLGEGLYEDTLEFLTTLHKYTLGSSGHSLLSVEAWDAVLTVALSTASRVDAVEKLAVLLAGDEDAAPALEELFKRPRELAELLSPLDEEMATLPPEMRERLVLMNVLQLAPALAPLLKEGVTPR